MTEQPDGRYFAQELAPDHNAEKRERVQAAP